MIALLIVMAFALVLAFVSLIVLDRRIKKLAALVDKMRNGN